MRLPVYQSLNLAASLGSGQAHRWRKEEVVVSRSTEVWHYGVIYGNFIGIRAVPAAPERGFEAPLRETCALEFHSAPHSTLDSLESLLRSYFRLDDDIEAIYQEITDDPQVALMVQRYRGLRLLRIEPWECLISFICSANSNIPRIHANMEALAEKFGRPLSLNGRVRYSFPRPEDLAEAGEGALRALGLGFRAPYVSKAALAVARGELDLEALKGMPYREAKERLIEIPGVGEKVADCVLLHSLDQLEAFPIDVWVRRALLEWYFSGQKPLPNKHLLGWAQEHFCPHAGYAQLYLFHGRRLDGR